MKKIAILLTFIGFVCSDLRAQNDADALRYSSTYLLGSTARSMGLGGAVGALGADPSVMLTNPAGLAQYKTSIFNVSAGMLNGKNSALYLDQNKLNSNYFKLSVPSINFVFTDRKMEKGVPAKKGWVNYNFGIGWNKTADFTRRISYKATNTQNSMLDYVADFVQGTPVSSLDANDEQLDFGFYYFENMFWYGYLIDTASNGNYYGYYNNQNPQQTQSGYINRTGGMNELNLSFAANYSHKLYLGFGFNVHSIQFEEKNTFTETDNPASPGDWNYFDFTRNLKTNGIGYSGRFGLIARPNDNIRIGASIHTPTVMNLTDNYSDDLYVAYDDGSSEDMSTIEKEYSYTISSPMRMSLQGAYIFGKSGFISAEVESVDYSAMNLSSDSYGFESENQNISNKYKTATNIKLGGEFALDEFRLRGGYAQMGNPFANENAQNRQFGSIGFGMQEKSWSFDLAVVKEFSKDEYVPYQSSQVSSGVVNNTFGSTQITLTLSTKF